MSLEKAIQHGKERRQPRRGAAAISPSCARHGGGACPHCVGNRTFQARKVDAAATDQIRGEGE